MSRIVSRGFETAKKILTDNGEILERLAHDLLERESVEGREVYELIEEITGEDIMPESMKKTTEPDAPADPPQGTGLPAKARDDESEEPGLAGGSLPSPATP